MAQRMRTSTRRTSFEPTRRTSRFSSTRRSLGCRSAGRSPISSRKTVPPCAASNAPTRSAAAPVKAPLTWPKSSLSTSSRESAAQSITRNGPPRRGLCAWISRAITSLPVPVSPVIMTVASVGAYVSARWKTRRIASERPTTRPNDSAALRSRARAPFCGEKTSAVPPSRSSAPGGRHARETRTPLTKVPLVLPRSSTA